MCKKRKLSTRQFATMIGAGLPLVQSLDTLAAQQSRPRVSEKIRGVLREVQSGATLADAMRRQRDFFGDVYVSMVAAGEVGGVAGGVDGYVRDITASFFVAAYVPLLAGFATMLVTPADGAGRILTFMIAVVCSDIGGYTAGVFLGRHPMAPLISPKKSWEGFAGSIVAGVVGTTLTVVLALNGRWWVGAVLGVAVVITATTGDLVESMIKRDLGIKDMGTLLPGHGGLMDRLDSLLPSAVVTWLLLSLLVPA